MAAENSEHKCSVCDKKAKDEWSEDNPYCSRGCRNIGWIEGYCIVPSGAHVNSPIVLREKQRKWIRGIYDTPTRRAIISVGRKNAKTATAATLLLLHLCGPEARQNSELYSSALSRDQAAIIFRLAAKMVRLSAELSAAVTIRETVKQLFCEMYGTQYSAVSADASTNFGLSPAFVVHDELGQVKGPRHQLYEALETATAAHEAPLSIIISTQAPNDGDLLSILIDDAQQENDPRTKLFFYSADEDLDPFSEEAIKQANPFFGDFQNAEEVKAMAEDARRMPSREAEYRNLVLNQRVEASNPFVSKNVWMANTGNPQPLDVCYGGLDLSEVNDLTALILVSPNRNHFDIESTFWLPEEGLAEKSRQDRVPYDVWAKEGRLLTSPGKSIEYEYVANYLAKLFDEKNIKKIAFDRHNMRFLRPWLIKAGLSESFIDDRFEDFGLGYLSMDPALRNLESLLLNERLAHGNHPILTMCAANAVVKRDEAGNRVKLDKKKSRGRIDGMVSLAMACDLASKNQHNEKVYPVALSDILEAV